MKRFSHTIFFFLALLVVLTPAVMAAPPELARRVVVLHDDVESPGAIGLEIARQVGGQLGFIYEHALKGFSIMVPPQAVGALEKNANVKYVATDDIRYAVDQVLPTGIARIFAHDNTSIDINGIDARVDVDVAVIDTGIDFNHPDLNVVGGINCAAGNILRAKCIEGGDDDHSHGTHVAGTIAALDNAIGVVGVAPGARLWAVKVLNSRGSGYTSWIIAGIDWVAARAEIIEVANMSLSGSGYNQAEYDAINGAVSKGVAFAVAAGNADADACNYSPASFDNVLTVSALADFDGLLGGLGSWTCRDDQDDTLADFSNWGGCIDLVAPGVCILSTVPGGGYATFSGTSMASPHVAGALALLASSNKPANEKDVHDLYDQVINAGNDEWTDDSGDGIQEPLLDVSTFVATLTNNGGSGENTPPTVNISSPDDNSSFKSGAPITFTGSAEDTEDGNLDNELTWRSNFVAEPIGTGGTFSIDSLIAGTHTITASVTDSGGLIGSASVTITINESISTGITLNVTAYKIKGDKFADLTWQPTIDSVIYRNSVKVATLSNSGTYTDGPLGKGGGSATYKVCEVGTETCSNEVTVFW